MLESLYADYSLQNGFNLSPDQAGSTVWEAHLAALEDFQRGKE